MRPCSPRAVRRVVTNAWSTWARIARASARKARLAAEQQDIELALERPDLVAERRLLDAEPLRRACDVAFLGDRQEVAQVAKLHAAIPIRYGLYRLHIMDPRTRSA